MTKPPQKIYEIIWHKDEILRFCKRHGEIETKRFILNDIVNGLDNIIKQNGKNKHKL